MGVSDLSVVISSSSAMNAPMASSSKAVSPTWRLVEASQLMKAKRSKGEKNKRMQCWTMPTGAHRRASRDLWHCANVSKFYPALFRVQRPVSPTSLCLEDEEADGCVALDAKWMISDRVLAFEELVHNNANGRLEMTSDGCGGAYFFNAEDQTIGIFKPRDEEYMSPNNPRGYVQEQAIVGETEHPINKGFKVGNGALRERAAYILDEAYGHFSGVPVTTLLTLPVSGVLKEGSMQEFVPSECSAEDMGTLKFSIPEVHKIGILDMRLLNTDRHAGNILLQPQDGCQTYQMTPIDHGFCLPSFRHLDNATFDWFHWPQAQFPFTSSELEHIASLNVEKDALILRALGFDEDCITTLRICTRLLQVGADAGFSLYEIAQNVQRDGDFSTPSPLEEIVARAIASVVVNHAQYHDAIVQAVEKDMAALFAGQPKKKVRSISCFS